ncbi:MAG TPA: DoxX family protein [Chthonomonadaceae bacterium]|jgi:thiosulfate dehydrogenase [quinone] large subunit|nr:DoxX family protein [Chthonomonadaceae bacterium]
MPKRPDGGAATGMRSAVLHPRRMALALALLRVFVGVKFLLLGMQKWDWIGTHRLTETLKPWIAQEPTAFAWHARFLTQTVLPHETLFTYLVVFGEIGVGLCLILGLLTRLVSLLALLMNANYLLAAWALGPTQQGLNQAFLAMELALLLSGAGRAYGLDSRLARKRPRWPLW